MNYAAFWSPFIIFWTIAIIVLAVQFLHQILSPPRKYAGALFPKLWAQQEELQPEQLCVSSCFSTWPIRSELYIAIKRLICGVLGHVLHSFTLCLFFHFIWKVPRAALPPTVQEYSYPAAVSGYFPEQRVRAASPTVQRDFCPHSPHKLLDCSDGSQKSQLARQVVMGVHSKLSDPQTASWSSLWEFRDIAFFP